MDLEQRKLSKSEWESIEVPVSPEEIEVLQMIIQGFHNVNIRLNNAVTIFTFLKIEFSEKMEEYLFYKYLLAKYDSLRKKFPVLNDIISINVSSKIQIKTADKIRLENSSASTMAERDIYEYVLFEHFENLVKFVHSKRTDERPLFLFHYFTLYKLVRNNVIKLNSHLVSMINSVLSHYADKFTLNEIISKSSDLIEKNKCLLKFADMQLYEHQKSIFSAFKSNTRPKLVFYIAPTGTGKTLTPLALSENYRVIFVCAARHVGLALARAAISVEKKIAFAFGCGSATDIRLHYYAAAEYTKNKRSGGIGKVDNENGVKVEIIVCDIKSYIPAMYYMKSFNRVENIITYWDEPTITMDYEDHAFHSIIHKNWSENIIPNFVLSSATLPKMMELASTVSDFKNKFEKAEIVEIVSHDCKKSIPLVNKDGYIFLPHYFSSNYSEIQSMAKYSENYLTLLRYFDLREVSDFIILLSTLDLIPPRYQVERYFETLDDFDMKKIKMYYLTLLQLIPADRWPQVFNLVTSSRKNRLPFNNTVDNKGNKIVKSVSVGSYKHVPVLSDTTLKRQASVCLPTPVPPSPAFENKPGANGLLVTTKDAYTLTDGPTIYISDDIEKIAKFCVQQANIPPLMMQELMSKIEFNNTLNARIGDLEVELEAVIDKTQKAIAGNSSTASVKEKDVRKFNREGKPNKDGQNEIAKLSSEIQALKDSIKTASLNDTFVPNKKHHLDKWAESLHQNNAFTSDICDKTVNTIMSLRGVDDIWKILLLMGIGVFTSHENITYTEVMKTLAYEQKLYLIIASSDYIYGTNYSFCHGYLSKDLKLTQEKIIQALGRIGRNNIQQDYTIRFRDDSHIVKLFTLEMDKPEVRNMNRLFTTAFDEADVVDI